MPNSNPCRHKYDSEKTLEITDARIATLLALISAAAATCSSQSNPNLQTDFRDYIGLSDDQIASIRSGQAAAKTLDSRTPDEKGHSGPVSLLSPKIAHRHHEHSRAQPVAPLLTRQPAISNAPIVFKECVLGPNGPRIKVKSVQDIVVSILHSEGCTRWVCRSACESTCFGRR